jgi:uncharacterized membrane-anchored protein YhcB (DUF1043 family)
MFTPAWIGQLIGIVILLITLTRWLESVANRTTYNEKQLADLKKYVNGLQLELQQTRGLLSAVDTLNQRFSDFFTRYSQDQERIERELSRRDRL